jgi:uroporphyrinogen III methyltransferase/synthase
MAESVTKAGGEPILFPTIAIEDVKDFNDLDEAINSISRYDWVIFTSVNGVERFFKRFFTLSNDIRQLSGPRIGAIGPITAAKLKDKHLHVELIAQEFVAEGLLESLEKIGVPGKRFLIPRAEKAREILPDGLTKLGGKVDVVSVYRTVLPSNDDVQSVVRMIDDGEIDAITFTSSSTVSHFMKLVEPEGNKLLEKVITASIGPVTSNTLREYGISPQIEASEYTIEGLISALKNYFGDQSRQLD